MPYNEVIYLGKNITSELGIKSPALTARSDWQNWFESVNIRDLLDAVTVIYRMLDDVRPLNIKIEYKKAVERIFKEENVGYTLDEYGIVHFSVDQEFHQAYRSTLVGLGLSRYTAVRTVFQDASAALDLSPPDGKRAVRSVFGAQETLFKLMFDRAIRLGSKELDQYLKPKLDLIYAAGTTEHRAALRILSSFKEWIEAAHFYRHEQGQEEPTQPPLDLVIVIMSAGTGYLRWLAEIDQALIAHEDR